MRSSSPLSRRLVLACCLLIGSLTATGCNYAVLFMYLIGGPPSITPDFERSTGKNMTDFDPLTGEDVKVAVMCYAPNDLKWDFDTLDHDLTKLITFRMAAKNIDMVPPGRVRAWLDENPDWDRPEEIGEALGANYVVYVDLQKFSLYEDNSRGELYRGRSESYVSVYEMDEDGNGDRIYSKELPSIYPLKIPRSSAETNLRQFKKDYLARLSEEIGRLFYPHYAGDDIPDAA